MEAFAYINEGVGKVPPITKRSGPMIRIRVAELLEAAGASPRHPLSVRYLKSLAGTHPLTYIVINKTDIDAIKEGRQIEIVETYEWPRRIITRRLGDPLDLISLEGAPEDTNEDVLPDAGSNSSERGCCG